MTAGFFVTADNVFGRGPRDDHIGLRRQEWRQVVVGSVQAPLNTPDFSSFLLQAQASHAKVIGLANSGADTINGDLYEKPRPRRRPTRNLWRS